MENASKAILIAGGILLTMLIISVLILARTRISDFYTNKDEFAEVEQVGKFNQQFSNYENRDVYGYELVSLANKVADYNMRYSTAEGARNDEKYNKIVMYLDFKGRASEFRYSQDQSTRNVLFNVDKPNTQNIENFIEVATGIEQYYQKPEIATKLAKSINSLILSEQQIEYNLNAKGLTEQQSKKDALEHYNAIVSDERKKSTYEEMVKSLTQDASIMKYYEYYQFKKAMFKCTGITYDNATGRVSTIRFEYVSL